MVFIRKNKNRSGSYSIQIVSKQRGTYKVLKTLGSGRSAQEIEFLYQRARQEIQLLEGSGSLFVDEDDLRRTGFSKVGKHKNPQIYLGLLVGLLSRDNISMLEANGYRYIIGARIKNESQRIKDRILEKQWQDGHSINIKKGKGQGIVVANRVKRAIKDRHNRERGLARLEKSLKRGRLTKANINNRGYNKYLKLTGEVQIEIDYDKYNSDQRWDGLKGYITNTSLRATQIIDNYNNLWQIEKAFRISKTDLKIRPIYHRLRHRIEGHICISFTAYSIYKELERILKQENSYLSVKRAAELTHNMYQLNFMLPESKHQKSILLKMNQEQADLYQIILKYY